MNTILLLGVSVVYLAVGVNYYLGGNTGLAVTFIAYSAANWGIWYAS